jgi:hypothetical protein
MTSTDSIHTALKSFAQIKASGTSAMIIRRDNHPHVDGTYFYAIRPADKHAWASGETALSQDEIADLWYGAGCPSYHLETR